ncbi:putative 5' nucleotidase [Acanthamoeba polyphaga moumouvirus]|uniref:Putative 5' nucleotidase n=1 Tax=Acanthamoeba polyphaga moumouvirus TaxID=1269028 RepID=L7RCS4_9VIRU|nr:putative 5' nucleotidase [Acanthamoeba polyphaga moumouvirus]AGC02424.1 putative 5' nucleotidase [Acanthamoeba polyphaga moumouvirus]
MELYAITKKSIRIGLNMDNILFDYNNKIIKQFENHSIYFLTSEEMYDSIISNNNFKSIYKDIIQQDDFYLDLEPVENILQVYQYLSTIKDVQNNNIFKVYIIGKPNKALSSKFNIIKKYFGDEAIKNTIFTKDKTIINLDILIDAENIIRGINGSSVHSPNRNAKYYPNTMSFQHIRYKTYCSYFTETICDHPVINNWTDNTYIYVIIKECVKLGLLTNDINCMPDIKLKIYNITGNKIHKFA